MRFYRLVLLGSQGEMVTAENFEHPSDSGAITVAKNIFANRLHYHGLELWRQGRLVYIENRAVAAGGATG